MEHTNDGLSRCECCDAVTPTDRLRPRKLGYAANGTRDIAYICHDCERALDELAMQLRSDVSRTALENAVQRARGLDAAARRATGTQIRQYVDSGEKFACDPGLMLMSDFLHYSEIDEPLQDYEIGNQMTQRDLDSSRIIRD